MVCAAWTKPRARSENFSKFIWSRSLSAPSPHRPRPRRDPREGLAPKVGSTSLRCKNATATKPVPRRNFLDRKPRTLPFQWRARPTDVPRVSRRSPRRLGVLRSGRRRNRWAARTERAMAEATAPSACFAELARDLRGFQVSRMIAVAAEIGLADRVAGGPRAVSALAAECGADPAMLLRLCRALAAFGIFTVDFEGYVGQSERSRGSARTRRRRCTMRRSTGRCRASGRPGAISSIPSRPGSRPS